MILRALLIFCLLLALGFVSSAQDIIQKHTGETIEATIVDISPGVIKYTKFNDPQGPVYSISRDQVAQIIYADGRVRHLEKDEDLEKLPEESPPQEMIRPSPTFGWHIGIGASSIFGDIIGAKAKLASAVGVEFHIPFGKNNGVLLGADVLSLGCNIEDFSYVQDDGTRVEVTNATQDFGYISALVADRFFLNSNKNYYLEGGFYASFLMSAFFLGDAEVTDTTGLVTSGSFNDELYDFYKAYDLGLLAGFGGRIPLGESKKWHLVAGARFYYGLTNLWDFEFPANYSESNIFGFVFVGVDIPTRTKD